MTSRAYDLARHLLDCVCGALGPAYCPRQRCVQPGGELILDQCCDGGFLGIQLIRQFPSRSFPINDTGVPPNCTLPYMVAQYRVTIARCVEINDPDCKAMDRDAQRTFADAEAVLSGIACCLNSNDQAVCDLIGTGLKLEWVFVEQNTFGPEGGCAGSTTDFQVGLPPCFDCCS